MFKININEFNKDLWITRAIPSSLTYYSSIEYFDKDGFELTELEQVYYHYNFVYIGKHLHHKCAQTDWITSTNRIGPVVDHSMILHRYGFAGAALEQLKHGAQHYNPGLYKLIQIKPKWGLDFSLDYIDTDRVVELLHFEIDYDNYDSACFGKKVLETNILATDWENYYPQLKSYVGSPSKQLIADDLSDLKAKVFGLNRAFDTQKVW